MAGTKGRDPARAATRLHEAGITKRKSIHFFYSRGSSHFGRIFFHNGTAQ
ncbi:hypothetical protein R6Q59_007145 [Mikania micrantha]